MLNIIGIILLIVAAFQIVACFVDIPLIFLRQLIFRVDLKKNEIKVKLNYFFVLALVNLIFDYWNYRAIMVMYHFAKIREACVVIPSNVELIDENRVRIIHTNDTVSVYNVSEYKHFVIKQMYKNIVDDSIVFAKNKRDGL